MKSMLVFAFTCVVALGTTAVCAQETTGLLFEISKNGSLVAKPQLRVESGRQGMIVFDERDAPTAPAARGLRERITLTPTIQGDNVAIAFAITSDSKQFRPSLVISRDIKGSLEWVSAKGETIRLTVSWVE